MNIPTFIFIFFSSFAYLIWMQTNHPSVDKNRQEGVPIKRLKTPIVKENTLPLKAVPKKENSDYSLKKDPMELSNSTPELKTKDVESQVITIKKKSETSTEVIKKTDRAKHIKKIFSNTYENEKKKGPQKKSKSPVNNDPNEIKIYDNKYQKTDKKVDILWVIDDSGSMKTHLESVSEKIIVFTEEFLKKNVSFKMGVVNTSIEILHEGNHLNSETYKKSQPEFIEKFNEIFNLRTIGAGEEKGLGAITHFLESSGERFLRPKSKLVVIVISDEDDQTVSLINRKEKLSQKEFSDIVSKYRSNEDFELYSIISFPQTSSSSLAGTRYADISYTSKGLVADIKGDFHQMLLNIGGRIVKSSQRKQ